MRAARGSARLALPVTPEGINARGFSGQNGGRGWRQQNLGIAGSGGIRSRDISHHQINVSASRQRR